MYIKKNPYAKIPNDFFYNESKILNEIGGRDSFLIYCLFISRKTMMNRVHITLKDIIETLQLDKNISRSKKRIINSLELLHKKNYIFCDDNLRCARSTNTMTFNLVDRFPNKETGWLPFYADDFELYSKIGATAYTLVWVLRMYRNHKTGNSFPSIKQLSETLSVSNTTVQNCLNLFSESNLFEISRGDYYYHPDLEQYIKYHNTYKYNYNIENLLDMKDEEISYFLKRKQ